MNDEQKYTIQGLEEYIRQGEPLQRERGEAWKVAIGLQKVDGLKTSEYLLDTARKDIQPSSDNVRRLVLAIGKEEMSGINNLTLPNKRNS